MYICIDCRAPSRPRSGVGNVSDSDTKSSAISLTKLSESPVFRGELRPHSCRGSGKDSDTSTAASTTRPEGQGGARIICANLEVVKASNELVMPTGLHLRCGHRRCWCSSQRSARLPPAILHRGVHGADRARGRARYQPVSCDLRDWASYVTQSSEPGLRIVRPDQAELYECAVRAFGADRVLYDRRQRDRRRGVSAATIERRRSARRQRAEVNFEIKAYGSAWIRL